VAPFSLTRWLDRASKFFEPADLWRLGPGGFFASALRLARERDRSGDPGEGVDRRDPEFVELMIDLFRAIGESYFRWKVDGVDRVPADGPVLLVGSHNGGLVTFDSLLTLVAIRDRFGIERAVHPLAHDLLFQDPRIREIVNRFGALRAGHDGAAKAFRAGHVVLVYPGSDLDTARAWKDRYRIELGGRKGFLRLALTQGIPIVPVVSTGTHEQFIVLTRGDELARRFGIKKLFRVEVFPIVLSLPWGLTSGYLPYLPLPAQTTIAFGDPIRWPHLGPEHVDDDATLDRCYEQVRAAMQARMDDISEGRIPWLGKA